MLNESFFLSLIKFSIYKINYEQNFLYFQSNFFCFFPMCVQRKKEREIGENHKSHSRSIFIKTVRSWMSEAIELTWNARHVYSPVSNCVTLLMSKPSARMRNFEALAVKAKRERDKERERNERNMINGCQRVGKITNRMEEREREGSKEDPNCASLTLDVLTLHADGLPVEVPGDIRLRFALHLAQNGGILSLLNGQHGVLFGKRNFLCVSMWGIQCKINESFAALDTLGYLSLGETHTHNTHDIQSNRTICYATRHRQPRRSNCPCPRAQCVRKRFSIVLCGKKVKRKER